MAANIHNRGAKSALSDIESLTERRKESCDDDYWSCQPGLLSLGFFASEEASRPQISYLPPLLLKLKSPAAVAASAALGCLPLGGVYPGCGWFPGKKRDNPKIYGWKKSAEKFGAQDDWLVGGSKGKRRPALYIFFPASPICYTSNLIRNRIRRSSCWLHGSVF